MAGGGQLSTVHAEQRTACSWGRVALVHGAPSRVLLCYKYASEGWRGGCACTSGLVCSLVKSVASLLGASTLAARQAVHWGDLLRVEPRKQRPSQRCTPSSKSPNAVPMSVRPRTDRVRNQRKQTNLPCSLPSHCCSTRQRCESRYRPSSTSLRSTCTRWLAPLSPVSEPPAFLSDAPSVSLRSP